MTTKERIHAAIDSLSEDRLDELYGIIQSFSKAKSVAPSGSIMDKLRRVQIDAPPDFSANLDQYASGEKRV